MQVEWESDKALPLTEEVRGPDGMLIFRGIRARVGLMHGEVLKITPHCKSGWWACCAGCCMRVLTALEFLCWVGHVCWRCLNACAGL
jgi:hypothetical protein